MWRALLVAGALENKGLAREDGGLKRGQVVGKSYYDNKARKLEKNTESHKSKYQELRIGLL